MPRHTPLVCQYLENISQEALEKYQDIIRDFIRGRHGVYALYRKGKLYYVGLAGNLRGRLRQHLRDRHGTAWDRFSVYFTVGNSHLRELESLLLRIVRPKGNKQIGKFHRSCENLRNRFSRDVRTLQRQELDLLLGRSHVEEEEIDAPTPTPRRRRRPTVADFIDEPKPLRGHYKGKWYRAQLRRDGTIRYQGDIFNSPWMAAKVALNCPSCNGWAFWHYERAPGDWVPLSELRR